jgi:Protein of unknown function (DUF3810)
VESCRKLFALNKIAISNNWHTWARVLAILLPVQVILFSVISNNTDWVENTYISNIFGPITRVLRFITAPIPFSIGLVFIYFLIALIIYSIIQFFRKFKKNNLLFINKLINLTAYISIIYTIYFMFWGFAYHRQPIAKTLSLNTENITYSELLSLTDTLIKLSNETRKTISSTEAQGMEIQQYFSQAKLGFDQIAITNKIFKYENTSIKFATIKPILSTLNTSGIYSFWSGEANINAINPAFVAPYTICHEMAHQIGFASEEEANFVSYLACINNPNKIFKYSAYSQLIKYSLRAVFNKDSNDYNKLIINILPENKADYQFANKQWEPYNFEAVNKITGYIYDLFLKANNQDQGLESYGQVVELMIAEKRKNGIK